MKAFFRIPAILIVLFSTLLMGCKSYSTLDVEIPKDKIYPKLDPLKPDLSLAMNLCVGGRIVFMHEVEDNICHLNPLDTHKLDRINMGYAKLTVLDHRVNRNPLWTLFCTTTSIPLKMPALLGIPVGHRQGVSEIMVDITSPNRNSIKSYRAKAKHVSFITCYWGYNKEDAAEKALDISFVKAMRKIKKQIDKDSDSINAILPDAYLSDEELLARQYLKIANNFYTKKNYQSAIENYLLADAALKEKKEGHAGFLYQLGISYIYTNDAENYDKGIDYLKKS
jgi:hypothetical protein